MIGPVDTAKLLDAVRHHPCGTLLAGQLLAVLAYPFLDDSPVGRATLGILGMGLVAAAIWAVRFTPVLAWVAVVIGIPAMAFTVAEAVSPDTGWIVLVSALLHAPFYFYVSWAMVRHLYADDRVTRDELFAIGAAFTVVAWGFAYLYAAVQVVWPGSFVSPTADEQTWFELLFVSFTNLTSVGFSDIVPTTEHARSIVIVQQFTGVLYVAMVVSRLVGLTVARAKQR